MTEWGRRRVATEAQCAQVRRLVAEGASLRQTAQVVFGDVRFRGRVERILRVEVSKEPSPDPSVPERLGSAEAVPTVRAALARYLARVERGDVQPSVAEMVKLLDLERRLQVFESIEQLNALTRAVDDGHERA
jgi:hypothetical protein